METEEIILLASQGRPDAIGALIEGPFKEYLCRIIARRCPDADTQRDIFQDFYLFLVKPFTDGRPRLCVIMAEKNPKSYLGRILTNFLNDRYKVEQREGLVDNEPDQQRTAAVDDGEGVREKLIQEKQIEKILDALENLGDIRGISDKGRYILLTYLIGMRFEHIGAPLKLAYHLAGQLDDSYTNVSNTFKRARDKFLEFANGKLQDELDEIE